MTQKDPIWPVRELMGYRPLLPVQRRSTSMDIQSGGAIEPLERRSMISGPMSIALAAAIAPVSEMHLALQGHDDSDSSRPDGTVAALADNDDEGASIALSENPGDAYEDAISKCRPELTGAKVLGASNVDELERTYTLATINLPATQHARYLHRPRSTVSAGCAHALPGQPDLALQIMASGVAIDLDQAAGISAMLNHHTLLPGIVFNPVAGIAALVA